VADNPRPERVQVRLDLRKLRHQQLPVASSQLPVAADLTGPRRGRFLLVGNWELATASLLAGNW
jgi:hypothetical protein